MNATRAFALIARMGRTVTLRTFAAGSYNDATRIETPGAATDTPVAGAQRAVSAEETDGVEVLGGDQKILVATAGLSVVPKIGDHVVIDSDVKRIVKIRPYPQGETVIAWDLYVRALE